MFPSSTLSFGVTSWFWYMDIKWEMMNPTFFWVCSPDQKIPYRQTPIVVTGNNRSGADLQNTGHS